MTVPDTGSRPASGLAEAGLVRNVRVGRQGIYDASRTLLAYELLFRSYDGLRSYGETRALDEMGGLVAAGDQATSQVIASTFGTFGLDTIANGRPVFINFTRAFLTGRAPIPLEPAGVVIEVLDVPVDPELIEGLTALREEGYRIALADYRGRADQERLLGMVDYVKVNVDANPLELLAEYAAQMKAYEVALVATSVNDEQTFADCVEMGFELFQGPMLQRPSVLERRTLTPTQLICVRLLGDLSDPDAKIQRIEQLVASDPGLAIRLLRTANSAASGLSRDVTSLRQALVIIGPRRLRSWVVLTLLEGGAAMSSSEGLWSVLTRAFTCQRLGAPETDLAFTCGLLSGAAELLGVEPEVIAEGSGINESARQALVAGSGAAGRALVAVLAHEREDEEGVASTGLMMFDVSRAYLEALSESLKLVAEING